MQRTRQIKKPNLVLCSDFHLRKDTLLCWTGDFQKEQWDSVDFVRNLQSKYDCPVIVAGDLFDKWYNSNDFLTTVMQHLPNQLYVIYGQHDLPNHSIDLAYKSSIDTLAEAGKVKILDECHYGQEPNKGSLFFPNREPDRTILIWHKLAYQKPPYPEATGGNAISILKKYHQFDLIVTGDNHLPFVEEYQGRLLVNPGCLTRQSVTEMNYKPRVYLWYADTNTVEPVYIPIQENVITREHIEIKEQRDARIDAFVSSFKDDYEIGLSFEQNLEEFFNKNQIRKEVKEVKEIIYKSIE